MKFEYGLVSVTFRHLSPLEIIELCKTAGLTCIEWGSDIHAPYLDYDSLIVISALQKQSGIRCSSYGTYFRIGDDKSSELINYINAAKILGTNILRLWCGNRSFSEYSQNERIEFIKECKKIAQIAEENNVIVCMECHNGTFTDSIDGALFLMKQVDSNSFQMYWQPNQYHSFRENCHYAKEIAKFTKRIHVFYWTKENMYPLVRGKNKWIHYLSNFKAETPLLLEFMPDGRPESLITEAKTLFEIGEKVTHEIDG